MCLWVMNKIFLPLGISQYINERGCNSGIHLRSKNLSKVDTYVLGIKIMEGNLIYYTSIYESCMFAV